MWIDFLIDVAQNDPDREAIIWNDQPYDYGWLLGRIEYWRNYLNDNKICPGSVVAIEADFSPNSVALFLTLIGHSCILVPLTSSVADKKAEFMDIARVEFAIEIEAHDEILMESRSSDSSHEYYNSLKDLGHPGLVLFSSGSTGKSKAAVHDFVPLLEKFKTPRHSLRSITFLLYDHIGGVNTLLYNLSNGGCIVTIRDRSPDHVLKAIERHQVELLPTAPTFLNLIILSEAYKRYDLSSLKLITYGTEPMLESTLNMIHEILPNVRLLQTYGLTEVGILRSKSKSNDSLWVKVGGEDFETRIVDGTLHIKAKSAMLGYLNAPNPFTEDGWFDTGDVVEVEGEYVRFLGRKSEVINVGGEKVYPAEVESVLQEMDNVAEVTVRGESSPITGNVVCARVRLVSGEARREFVSRMRRFCKDRIEPYKIPVKVQLTDEKQYSGRFKKVRR